MALSLEEYLEQSKQSFICWDQAALPIEKDIDKTLQEAMVINIIPDSKNPNFVCRYKFSNKIPKQVKDLLRVKYGQLGWTIKEDVDFKDFNVFGFFDFYKAEVK